MVSSPEEFTEIFHCCLINMSLPKIQVQGNHSVSFLIYWIFEKTSVLRLSAAKSKRKAIRAGYLLWQRISNRRGHTKINQKVKEALYNWTLCHHQVLKYPIANDCFYPSIDGNSKKY